MEKEKKENRRKNQQPPIIDGDARPDQLDEKDVKRKLAASDEEEKFTTERGSDVNSLENFKDEK
jgi:hypothetical protein